MKELGLHPGVTSLAVLVAVVRDEEETRQRGRGGYEVLCNYAVDRLAASNGLEWPVWRPGQASLATASPTA